MPNERLVMSINNAKRVSQRKYITPDKRFGVDFKIFIYKKKEELT